MDHFMELPPPCRPRSTRGLLRWLSNQNPFYVLSAVLVLLGLRMSFDPMARNFPAWAFLLGLAGFILLLAGTACVLVRLGNVWDDVRTLLLLIVLVFLAIAMIFDDILIRDRSVGLVGDIGGVLFAVSLSEALLRGMRLRLPLGFRLPYHLSLALVFLYPVALSPWLGDPGRPNPTLLWALFGFSPMAGLVALSLLPAIRRGPSYVKDNGSPWIWPLYPWSLFVVLGVGLGARAGTLCWSMHAPSFPELRESIFQPYFLVPYLLALVVLLLELGLVSRSRLLQGLALAGPLGLLALSVMGEDSGGVSRRFLLMFVSTTGGSPLYLTLLATAAFYAMAAARRVPLALGGLSGILLALVFVDPWDLNVDVLEATHAWPLWALAGLHGFRALRGPTSGRSLLAAACLIAAVAISLPESWTPPYRAAMVLHGAIAASLLIGLSFRDPLAKALEAAGFLALTLANLSAATGVPRLWPEPAPESLAAYPLMATTIAATYGVLLQHRLAMVSASVSLGGWLLVAGSQIYRQWRLAVAGLDQIVLGLVFFALAALISLAKAGVVTRWFLRWRGKVYHPE